MIQIMRTFDILQIQRLVADISAFEFDAEHKIVIGASDLQLL